MNERWGEFGELGIYERVILNRSQVECADVDWIHMAKVSVQWCFVMNTVMRSLGSVRG
jgi:hypothetical protein